MSEAAKRSRLERLVRQRPVLLAGPEHVILQVDHLRSIRAATNVLQIRVRWLVTDDPLPRDRMPHESSLSNYTTGENVCRGIVGHDDVPIVDPDVYCDAWNCRLLSEAMLKLVIA